jgi:hypothetical protein
MTFTNSWDQTKPAGTDAIALGDDQIRQFKLDIRERVDVEHDFPGASGNLRHKFPYVTTAARDAITDWVVGSICFNTNLFAGFVTLQIVTAVGPVVWTTVAVLDHGSLTGLGDVADHPGFTLIDGTRAFTGDQSMGSKNLTNVLDPTANQHAATKKYVDDADTTAITGVKPLGGHSLGTGTLSIVTLTDLSVSVTLTIPTGKSARIFGSVVIQCSTNGFGNLQVRVVIDAENGTTFTQGIVLGGATTFVVPAIHVKETVAAGARIIKVQGFSDLAGVTYTARLMAWALID